MGYELKDSIEKMLKFYVSYVPELFGRERLKNQVLSWRPTFASRHTNPVEFLL